MNRDPLKIKEAIGTLEKVRELSASLLNVYREELKNVLPRFRDSSINLIQYLALRQFAGEPVMEFLGTIGLSRLFNAEKDVMNRVDAVLAHLRRIQSGETGPDLLTAGDLQEGLEHEKENTRALLGPEISGRMTRIMVTLPSDAAFDNDLIADLLASDINCFRINCAHDGPIEWKLMIDKINKARKESGKDCRICMDLGGPKFRTGHMRPGPKVIRLRPEKNEYGVVVNPIKFWIAPQDSLPENPKIVHVPVEEEWYQLLKKDDIIRLQDARGKKRRIRVVEESYRGKWGIVYDTTYLRTGTMMHLMNDQKEKVASAPVGELLPLEEKIVLRTGDRLILHRKPIPGAPAEIDDDGTVMKEAHISCPLKEIFTDTKPGERILLDDGKIEGKIESVSPDELVVAITWADDKGSRLAADKGINLPDSELTLKGLTDKDIEDLKFVARHADVVNVSFVKNAEDLADIKKALKEVNGEHLGVILKIETQLGYENLPEILLNAMQFYPVGVMIARGDLAVEVGWQNLAEVQEEIIKLCSAAHIPDIWATQVLETLAKKGRPSRAEITDAAMAQRADCVMLNKGPHIIEAIKMLDGIIRLMQKTMDEKKPRVRKV